jgi:membrane protein implicated in regulation of membrane protease activity
MSFDLRFPLGMMFTVFGLILTGVGLFGGADLPQISLGINMNLWWGLVMLAFGLWMLLMAFRGMAKARNLKAETRNE